MYQTSVSCNNTITLVDEKSITLIYILKGANQIYLFHFILVWTTKNQETANLKNSLGPYIYIYINLIMLHLRIILKGQIV